MRRMGDAVLLFGLTLAAACSGDPAGIQAVNRNADFGLIATPSGASADLVAKAIAMALGDPKLRADLRSAMRMSPVTEHKLVLQEFATTERGAALISAGARRLGVPSDSILRTIASLPALDFYVPNRGHRNGWRGEASILVGSAMGSDRSVYLAHSTDGGNVRFAGDPSVARAVFLLHPAERKALRINRQDIAAGVSIQDSNEDDLGGSIVEYLPNGTTRETDLAAIHSHGGGNRSLRLKNFVPCDPDCGGGGDPAPHDTTFLETLVVLGVCDNGNCSETNEFEWHTYISHDNGATFSGRLDLRLVGIPSDYENHIHEIALFAKPQPYSSDLIESDIVETDGISPSDNYGGRRWHPATYSTQSENNMMLSEGDHVRCEYVDSYGRTWYCDQGIFWRDVNQSMLWRLP